MSTLKNRKKCSKPKILVASLGCPDDAAAVACLPDDWDPKAAGPTLHKYLKEQCQKHEQIIKDMFVDAQALNKNIEKRVEEMAAILLSHIEDSEQNIEYVLQKAGLEEPLTTVSRDEALNEMSKLHAKRIKDIDTFKKEGHDIEGERCEAIKRLLKDYFQRLNAVAHNTRQEITYDFEKIIVEVNHQLASNLQAYAEVQEQLQFQADEELDKAKSILDQFVLSLNRNYSATISLGGEKKLSIFKRSISILSANKTKPANQSISKLFEEGGDIKECFNRLVEKYKKAVMSVFTEFSGHLDHLHKNLDKRCISTTWFLGEKTSELAELQKLIERVVGFLSKPGYDKKTSYHVQTDADAMKRSLCELGEQLQNTYSILHDSGYIFDEHMRRTGLAQQLNTLMVEDLVTKNDSIELVQEINFNLTLLQLSHAPEPDKLESSYQSLVSILDRTGELYLSHCEAEYAVLEEYMNFLPILATTLNSEYKQFIDKYPRLKKQTSSLIHYSIPSSPGSEEFMFFKYILQTEIQGLALQNWANGYLESLESHAKGIPDLLRDNARRWIADHLSTLHMRYTLKMVSHNVRYERIKTCRDRRLATIRFHETRLNTHLAAITDLITRLPGEASTFLDLDSPQLYPLHKWIDGMKQKIDSLLAENPIDPEVKHLKMSSYGLQLNRHRNLFEASVIDALAKWKNHSEQRYQEARIANARFLSQVKLVREGGWYSAAEALKTSAALVKGSDMLEANYARTMDTLKNRRSNLMLMADQYLTPLRKIIDENVNHTHLARVKPKSGKGK